MSESRFPLIAMLLILIANFAIYGIILVPGNTFAGMDFLNLTYPRTVLARDALSAGHVPLWNWYEWGGAPLLATALGAVCYPLTWLAMLLPLPYGLQLFVFVHLLVAGSGAWLLSRQILRLAALPAAYTAIAYAGNAFFIGRIEQSQVIAANAYLPWLIWGVWRAVFRRQAERPWITVIWALTLLAGHPQFAAFNVIAAVGLTGLAFVFMPSRRQRNWKLIAMRWWRVGWQFALGTGLAAVQLLPTWELAGLSERIWPYPDPTVPELAWKNLPALLIPHYYNMTTGEVGRVMGYTELGLYAGVLTLPLALAGFCRVFLAKKRGTPAINIFRRRVVIAVGVVWLMAMIFALGNHAGVATLVYDYFPFFKQSRGAARSLNIAALMLALLSGQGVAWLGSALARKRHSRGRISTGSASARKVARQVAVAFCLVTIADLAAIHSGAIRSILISTDILNTRPLMPEAIRTELESGSSRVYRFMAFDSDLYLNNTAPAVAERLVRLQPNLNSLSRLGLTDGYEEGLFPLRYRANMLRQFNRNLRGPSPDASLLSAMGAKLMFTEYPIYPEGNDWTEASPVYTRSSIVPSLNASVPPAYQWWESPFPAARIYSLEKLIPAGLSAREFLARMRRDYPLHGTRRIPTGKEPRDHILAHIPPETLLGAASFFADISDYSHGNYMEFTVEQKTSIALVMLSPYPGWKVSGNNLQNGEIKPLNSLSCLVQLRSNSTVPYPAKLIFSPFSFRLGLFCSLISGTLLLITFLPGPPDSTREKPTWKQWSTNEHE